MLRALVLALACFGLATPALATGLTTEDRQAIELVAVHLPELRGRPLVHVAQTLVGTGEERRWNRPAFLVREDARTLVLLDADLEVHEVPRRNDLPAGVVVTETRELDVIAHARNLVAERRAPLVRGPTAYERPRQTPVGLGVLALALACARNGDEALAHEARIIVQGNDCCRPEDASFCSRIRTELAHRAFVTATHAHWDEPWPRLLERYVEFLNHFPGSPHAPAAREAISTLARMIERPRHESGPEALLDRLTERRCGDRGPDPEEALVAHGDHGRARRRPGAATPPAHRPRRSRARPGRGVHRVVVPRARARRARRTPARNGERQPGRREAPRARVSRGGARASPAGSRGPDGPHGARRVDPLHRRDPGGSRRPLPRGRARPAGARCPAGRRPGAPRASSRGDGSPGSRALARRRLAPGAPRGPGTADPLGPFLR